MCSSSFFSDDKCIRVKQEAACANEMSKFAKKQFDSVRQLLRARPVPNLRFTVGWAEDVKNNDFLQNVAKNAKKFDDFFLKY